MEKFGLTKSLYEAQKASSMEERLNKDLDFLKGEQKLSIIEREHQLKLIQATSAENSVLAKMEEMDRKRAAEQLAFEIENDKRQRDHEQYLTKLKLDADKAFRDMEMLKEKIRYDEESNRRKDYYENRSYDRKDSSELVKWLPGIILGAGLLIPKLMS